MLAARLLPGLNPGPHTINKLFGTLQAAIRHQNYAESQWRSRKTGVVKPIMSYVTT
jgi:hypothetical protein